MMNVAGLPSGFFRAFLRCPPEAARVSSSINVHHDQKINCRAKFDLRLRVPVHPDVPFVDSCNAERLHIPTIPSKNVVQSIIIQDVSPSLNSHMNGLGHTTDLGKLNDTIMPFYISWTWTGQPVCDYQLTSTRAILHIVKMEYTKGSSRPSTVTLLSPYVSHFGAAQYHDHDLNCR